MDTEEAQQLWEVAEAAVVVEVQIHRAQVAAEQQARRAKDTTVVRVAAFQVAEVAEQEEQEAVKLEAAV